MLSPQYSREFAQILRANATGQTGRPASGGGQRRARRIWRSWADELAREWPALVKRRENETLAEAGARFLNELAGRAIDPSKEAGEKPTDCEAGDSAGLAGGAAACGTSARRGRASCRFRWACCSCARSRAKRSRGSG